MTERFEQAATDLQANALADSSDLAFSPGSNGLDSCGVVSFAIFPILIAAAISFAAPPPDAALMNPNADSRGDDNDDSPAISASPQLGITSVHPAKEARCGEMKADGPEARAGNDEDRSEGDDDAKGPRLAQCDRHDQKTRAVSKATPADNDSEDDDDDNEGDAKQVKGSDSKPVPGTESHFDFYRDTDGNLTVAAGSTATSLLGDALLQLREDQLMARWTRDRTHWVDDDHKAVTHRRPARPFLSHIGTASDTYVSARSCPNHLTMPI